MDDRFVVGNKLPASLGACADLLHEVTEIRLAMQKQVDDVEKREKEIEAHITATGSAIEGETGWAGLKYRVQIVLKEKVKVMDWPAFHQWIRENDRLDMLDKRISKTASTDYVKEMKAYPGGTEKFIYKDLSVTKV